MADLLKLGMDMRDTPLYDLKILLLNNKPYFTNYFII
jgi:hypothetical protein